MEGREKYERMPWGNGYFKRQKGHRGWDEKNLRRIKFVTILMTQRCPELLSTLPTYLSRSVNAILGLLNISQSGVFTARLPHRSPIGLKANYNGVKQNWWAFPSGRARCYFRRPQPSLQTHGLMLDMYPELWDFNLRLFFLLKRTLRIHHLSIHTVPEVTVQQKL